MSTEEDTNRSERNSLWQDTGIAEDSCCRVCHGESEPDRPLFHPCRCDGSIKFVHQDCLMEWLKVSRQSKPRCELCGEVFSFRRVYKTNAPSQLSVFEFVIGLLQRIQGHVEISFRAMYMFFVWMIVLPLVTSFVFEHSMALLCQYDARMPVTNLWSAGYDIIPFWWNGVVVAVLMLCSFFGVCKLAETIYREIDRAIRAELAVAEAADAVNIPEVPVESSGEDDLRDTPGEAEAMNVAQDTGGVHHVDNEINELNDHQHHDDGGMINGNMREQVRNMLLAPHVAEEVPQPRLPADDNTNDVDIWQMSALSHAGFAALGTVVIMLSISLFIMIPVYVGRMLLQALLPSWNINFLHLHAKYLLPYFSSLSDISVPGAHPTMEGILLRVTVLVEGYVGMLAGHLLLILLAAAVIKYRGASVTSVVNRTFPMQQIQATVAQSYILRFMFIATVEFALVPQLMGWVIDVITMETCGTSLALRLQLLHKRPLISTLVRQVAGFCFMHHVGVVVTELKSLMKPTCRMQKYLPNVSFAFFEDEIENDRRIPMLTLVEKLLIHMIYTIVGIWIFVLLPLKFGHYLFGLSEPLRLKFDELESDMQLPVEMLLFHFLFPFLLQRINQRAVVTWVLRQLLLAAGRAFHTYDFLSDDILREEGLFVSPLEVARRRLLAYTAQLKQHQARLNELMGLRQAAGAQEMPAGEEGAVASTPAEQDELSNLLERVRDGGREIETIMTSIMTADPATLAAGLDVTSNAAHALPEDYRNRTYSYVCTALLFAASMVVVHVYVLMSPIYIGRIAMPYLKLNVQNDLYSASVGVTFILVVGFVITSIVRELNHIADVSACVKTFNKWACIIIKVIVLGALWFIILPILAGAILALTVVTPLKTHLAETPMIAWHYFCTGGLIFLKAWMSLVLSGLVGMPTMRRRMNQVMNNGIVGINFTFVLKKILFPVIWNLLEYLVVPYVLGRVLGLVVTTDYSMRSIIMRYSFVTYMCALVAYDAFSIVKSSIVKLHNDILDARYLVGTELTNR